MKTKKKEIRASVDEEVKNNFDAACKIHGLKQGDGVEQALKQFAERLVLKAPGSEEILKALS